MNSLKNRKGQTLFEAIIINKRNDLLVSPFFAGVWNEVVNMAFVKKEAKKHEDLLKDVKEFDVWENSMNEAHKLTRMGKMEEVKELMTMSPGLLNERDMYGYGLTYWAFVSGCSSMVDFVILLDTQEPTINLESIFMVVRRLKHNHLLAKLRQLSSKACNHKYEYPHHPTTPQEQGDGYQALYGLINPSSLFKHSSLQQVKEVVSSGRMDLSFKDSSGKGVLLKAVDTNRLDLVEYLFSTDLSWNDRDFRHRNVFHLAVQNLNAKMVSLLYNKILKKAGLMETLTLLNQKDKYVGSELCMLLKGREGEQQAWFFVEVLRGLLHKFMIKSKEGGVFDVSKYGKVVMSGVGENPSQEDKDKVSDIYDQRKAVLTGFKKDQTPLHIAAYNGSAEVVEVLLKLKVMVDCRDCFGMTPLHHAAGRGHKTICDMLLDSDADPELLDSSSKNAVQVANDNGHQSVAKFISAARYMKINKVAASGIYQMYYSLLITKTNN